MKYLFANWKLNPIPHAAEYPDAYKSTGSTTVVVFAPYTLLHKVQTDGIEVGGQFGSTDAFGAYTGTINMPLLKEIGCTYVLCGHSERRKQHDETNEDIAEQVKSALDHGLTPVLCIGETLEQREAGQTEAVLQQQLNPVELTENCIVAYEPVWAIGTGVSATVEQVAEAHAWLREHIGNIPLLYGGSMKLNNCKELLSAPNVDGGLVGGASLKPAEFAEMVQISDSL